MAKTGWICRETPRTYFELVQGGSCIQMVFPSLERVFYIKANFISFLACFKHCYPFRCVCSADEVSILLSVVFDVVGFRFSGIESKSSCPRLSSYSGRVLKIKIKLLTGLGLCIVFSSYWPWIFNITDIVLTLLNI